MSNIKRKKINPPIDQEPRNERGLRHGEWIWYHLNGRLMCRWNYHNDIKHGFSETYHSNGYLISFGYFDMGKKIGYWYEDCFEKQKYYYLWVIYKRQEMRMVNYMVNLVGILIMVN